MKYSDLENDNITMEHRVKHIEREAGFVRDYVTRNDRVVWVLIFISIINVAFNILNLIKR